MRFRKLIWQLVLPITIVLFFSCKSNKKTFQLIPYDLKETKEFAVVELFTSEGCSSCPSADESLSKLKAKYKNKNILLLAEHVDYWNDLIWGEGKCKGEWTDPFSDGLYSYRQFMYTNHLKTRPATPQFIVNGQNVLENIEFENLVDTLENHLLKDSKFKIELSLNQKESDFPHNQLTIDYKYIFFGDETVKKGVKPLLTFLILEKELYSTPDKGENCGTKIHHSNVVRKLSSCITREWKSGSKTIFLPNNFNLANCEIVAFVQNMVNLEIIAATRGGYFDQIK